jgi:hypothetical protein
MSLSAGEFMRRFLMHVLPEGFHRIRYYGLFANGHRAAKLALCRRLLAASTPDEGAGASEVEDATPISEPPPCPCCGGRMSIVMVVAPANTRPRASFRAQGWDTS